MASSSGSSRTSTPAWRAPWRCPAPTARERTQWYFQRYVAHLPAAGEIVLLDRSWYNRAGVEHVMGFCTPQEYERFLRQCPVFEDMLIEDGILLRKYWFSVSPDEQERRFRARQENPIKRWKLSPMDLESISRWDEYSKARDAMLAATDTDTAPWTVVESEDKRRARLNTIAHLLEHGPVPRRAGPQDRPAGAAGAQGLRAASEGEPELRARPCRDPGGLNRPVGSAYNVWDSR